MKIIRVIESKVWNNKRTGAKASIYGSVPWMTDAGRADWEMVTQGWTWELTNGTIGFGRVPAKTREEAEAVMLRFNSR